MNKSDMIFVAGASGMVGSAIIRCLLEKGYKNIVGSFHSKKTGEYKGSSVCFVRMDLKDQAAVYSFFKVEKPSIVFLAAAKVGGIHANNTYPAQFIHENLLIQTNIIHASYENRVKRLLFLGSSCIYPKMAPQPMKEEYLLTGLLEPTNEPYAVAKIAGIKMCESYNRQYGTRFAAAMPTNLYGPNDNFDLKTSHVLPAMIRKFHEAKVAGESQVVIWGTGTPKREFLHVDDMADGCVHLISMEDEAFDRHLINYPSPCFVNVGTGKDCTIEELALLVKRVVGFEGKIAFDKGKPDGTPRKLLDVSSLASLGWQPKISLEKGIMDSYQWYLQNAC